MEFKAAMFDFDGTITEKGSHFPDQNMADKLVLLAQKMPICFCTGRQLESFEKHGLDSLLSEIKPDHLEKFLENLFLVAENGAIGYKFNTDLDKFEEFYRGQWPNQIIDRQKLMSTLVENLSDIGNVHTDAHKIVIVIGVRDYKEKNIDEVYASSEIIFEKIINLLQSIEPDYSKYFHIGNSGIGVVIGPADSDKDRGIKEFARYLTETRGYEFSENINEIIAIGDSPQEGGNDHFFLKGIVGTPFTVGYFDESSYLPFPVLNNKKQRLLHAKGTSHLIDKLLNNNITPLSTRKSQRNLA